MSKENCKIIQDLLPLYVDDIASDPSKKLVEDHLSECEECSNILRILKKHVNIPAETKNNLFKTIKKNFSRKKIKVAAISVICSLVCVGFLYFIFNHQIPITYSEDLFDINLAYDGVIDILFNGDNYYGVKAFTDSIEKDGIKQNVVFIQYSDSIWTKLYNNKKQHEPYQFSIGNTIMIDFGKKSARSIPVSETISAIYYLTEDYRTIINSSGKELIDDPDKSILIWER